MFLRLVISVRHRVMITLALLGALGALALAADVFVLVNPRVAQRSVAVAATRGLTPRQVILSWFDAWNANDARRVCSFYGKDLLSHLGGDVDGCAASYGQLERQLFQIASMESDGETVTVGVIAGTHGGAVYLAREHGVYKIVAISA